jgi:cytochrome P450
MKSVNAQELDAANTELEADGAVRPYAAAPKMGAAKSIEIAWMAMRGIHPIRSIQEDAYSRMGPVIRQRFGVFTLVNLLGPDANRLVLTNRDRIFSSEIPWTALLGDLFPNGLMLKDGTDHRHHRKIMHQAFTTPALKGYADGMRSMIEAGVSDWGSGNGTRPMYRSFKELTLEIAASIFMGEELGQETRAVNRAFEQMVAASATLLRIPMRTFQYGKGIAGRRRFTRYLQERIDAKRLSTRNDMFSRLCEAKSETGDAFSDPEVIDHMVFLMMAAHDTTTSTLTSMTYLLAKHPTWQDRLREECLALGHDAVDFDAQSALRDTTLAMKETLRMYPPLATIPRVATAPFEFGGFEIPGNTMISISPVFTHYMGEYWTNPESFDPERFSTERAEHEQHSHLWIPFGGGAHVCLGMRFAETQIRMIMHQLLTRYRFEAPANYVMPVQEAPISKPRDGLPLRVVPLR